MTSTPTPSPGTSGAGEMPPLTEPLLAFVPDANGGHTRPWQREDDVSSMVIALVTAREAEVYGDARAAHAAREARAEERARVVAWLDNPDVATEVVLGGADWAREAIERGDHERTPDEP